MTGYISAVSSSNMVISMLKQDPARVRQLHFKAIAITCMAAVQSPYLVFEPCKADSEICMRCAGAATHIAGLFGAHVHNNITAKS